LKVLHFSATDGHTGAGGAAARIHQGLLTRGVESRFCVVHPTVGLENSFTPQISLFGRAVRKARRTLDDWMIRRVAKGYDYLLSTGACGFDIAKIVRQERPDIVQLHLMGFNTFRLATLSGIRKPVVWRFPDQWAFCGLPHYEPNPDNYSTPPSSSPIWSGPWTNLSEHVRYRKSKTYSSIDQLVLVCPSGWLAAETKRSALLGKRPIELIPTSCDTTLFSPKDRNVCRTALGLSPDSYIILVGAGSLELRSKGLDLFLEAMANICKQPPAGPALEIVTFGKDAFNATRLGDCVHVSHLGHVSDRRLLSIIYNAADVFAAPSRMENLANTVLESLACGTPVIAFDIGGMPDVIEHKVNGYLAPPFNTVAFADGIRWCLAQRDREGIRFACRDKVLQGFSREQEIDRYISLYESLVCGSGR
jgi:glycosyltransferase involved in cell wall biosynthesis